MPRPAGRDDRADAVQGSRPVVRDRGFEEAETCRRQGPPYTLNSRITVFRKTAFPSTV